MSGIKKNSGREAPEEFGADGIGLESSMPPPDLSDQEQMQLDASTTFPNENELLPLDALGADPPPLGGEDDTENPDASAQSIEAFKFLECDPLIPGDEVEPCPICSPNPYAYVPDWRLMNDGDVFFDGKNCTQNIVLTAYSPAPTFTSLSAVGRKGGGPSLSTLKRDDEASKIRGIELLLDYFNKSDIATVYYYTQISQLEMAEKTEVSDALQQAAAVLGAVAGGIVGYVAGGSAASSHSPPPKSGYALSSEEVDVVKELLQYTEIKYSVPIQLHARTRVLVSISVEYLDRVPVKIETNPTTKFDANGLEVVIDGEEFYPMFGRVIRALRVYANKMDSWVTIDGGALIKSGTRTRNDIDSDAEKFYLNLRHEAAFLENARDSIREMVKEGTGMTFQEAFTTRLEKIKIKFEDVGDGVLKIKQIIVNKLSCPEVIFAMDSYEFGTHGKFWKYMKDASFDRSTTLYYLGALPEMDLALRAREEMPWLEFVTKFTYPGLEVLYGSNSNSLMNDPALAQCFSDISSVSIDPISTAIQGTEDLINTAIDVGMDLPNAILANFSKNTCKTREEIKAEFESLGDGKAYADQYKQQLKRIKEIGKGEIEIDEPTLDIILATISASATAGSNVDKGVSRKVGKDPKSGGLKTWKQDKRKRKKEIKQNVKNLWRECFNKLGFCGLMDLVMGAINCVSQGLAEKDAMAALTEAAFGAMSDAHFERIFLGLPPEQQEAIAGQVREEFEGLPAPWEMGYVAGSYSGPAFSEEEKKEQREAEAAKTEILSVSGDPAEKARAQLNAIQAELDEISNSDSPNVNEYHAAEDAYAAQIAEMETAGYEVPGDTSQPSTTTGDSPPPDRPESTFYEPLGTGSTGDDVTTLQETLAMSGYDSGPSDREYNEAVEAAVRTFQENAGLEVTGQADMGTLSALNAAMYERIDEINRSAAVGAPAQQSLFGMGYSQGTFSFGEQTPGSGGTYGTALGNIQKVLFDAYRNALLQVVEADVLLDELNRLPGAPIIVGIMQQIKHMPCQPPPLLELEPRLDSFMNTLEADLCNWDLEIKLPSLSKQAPREAMLNLFRMIGIAILEALKAVALAIAMEVLKQILEKTLSAACDALATMGASLLDLVAGNDHFKDLLHDNLCPDATDEDMYNALKDILQAITDPDASCLETLTNAEMGEFIDDISLMLTQGQVLQLLMGTASQETLTLALEVAATSDSECIREIFSNPAAFNTFFPALGTFIPDLGDLADALAPGAFDRPVHPCPPGVLQDIDDLRCQLLQEKGLTPSECRDMLDDLKDQALQDLKDLADILNNGPFSNFPPLTSEPGCPPTGFYPPIDPLMKQLNASVSSAIFRRLEETHIRDLMAPLNWFNGRGGLINAILSDTKGRPWHMHNWMVAVFGSPLASQMGVFEWNCDNSIIDPGASLIAPNPIDIYGNKLSDFGASWTPRATGGYAPTVGAWMYKSLRDLKPSFKTITVPAGFASTQDALDAWQAAYEENLRRIAMRKEYLEAYFDKVEFDDGGPHAVRWPQKFADAKSDILKAASGMIFARQPTDPDAPNFNLNPGHELYSGEDRLWKILTAQDISIAGYVTPGVWYGDWKKTIPRPPDEQIPGPPFYTTSYVNAHPDEAALLVLPDTSSADIKLHFADYGDGTTAAARAGQIAEGAAAGAAAGIIVASIFTAGLAAVPAAHIGAVAGGVANDPGAPKDGPLYQFDLEYDYNLFDEDGVLRKDNKYKVRINVTVASPSGNAAERNASRKSGGAGTPPVSILNESPYTYLLHDISSESVVSEDVQEYLDNLDVYNDSVKDSYEMEAMYKFISEALISASSNVEEARRIIEEDPSFRAYFASTTAGTAYDVVSNGFLKRVSTSIARGRSDMPPAGTDETDSEPGFLEPPESEEAAHYAAQDRAMKMALNTISPGFLMGYDPYKEPTIDYLDPQEYGGTWARFLMSMGYDAESVPQPFYVEEPKFGGWMDLSRIMVPEVDGCDPARTPLYDLSDVSKLASQLGSDLLMDPRLKTDPLCVQEAPYDKVLEVPVCGNIDGAIRAIIRIYTLDIFIRSIPAFVVFGMTEENYDDLLMAYVAEKIKYGLNEDGRLWFGKADDTYYYRVLEQCVNNTVRKLDAGLIKEEDLTDQEKAALEIIVKAVEDFYTKYDGKLAALSSSAISATGILTRAMSTPAVSKATGIGKGSADFNKNEALAAKNLAFEEMIRETEDSAIIFLKRYIREEFGALRKSFSSKIPSFVDNVHHLFLLSDAWVHGGVYGNGPFDVQSDPTNREDYNISVGIPPTIQRQVDELRESSASFSIYNQVADNLEDSAQAMNENWPFVLEKYIRIEEKEVPHPESSRKENLYDIVNINDWDAYVKDKKSNGLEGDISEFWGNPTLTGETKEMEEHTHNYEVDEFGNGITSTHIDDKGNEHYHIIVESILERGKLNPEDNGHKHEIEITGWRFGLRLSYIVEKDKNGIFKEAMKTIASETSMNSKAYNLKSPEGGRYLIPIATGELPIPDQEFTLFNPDSYDVYCLIQELVKTVEYRTWFKYMFPLSRYTSLMAIYISQGFFASLGNSGWPEDGGDMWEVAGGNFGLFANRFRKWARNDEEVYKSSRNEARDIFTTLYDTAASIDFQSENKYNYKNTPDSVRDLLRPKVNFEDGLRWWQRGRRIFHRPYDKDGNECED